MKEVAARTKSQEKRPRSNFFGLLAISWTFQDLRRCENFIWLRFLDTLGAKRNYNHLFGLNAMTAIMLVDTPQGISAKVEEYVSHSSSVIPLFRFNQR